MLFGNLIRIPLGSVAIYPHEILMAIFVIGKSIAILKKRKNSWISIPHIYPVLAILFSMAVSLVLALEKLSVVHVGISSLYLVRFALYAGMFISIWFSSHKQKKNIRTGLLFFGLFYGALGLFQFFLYPNIRNLMYLGWDPHEWRLTGTLLDPNFSGVLLVLSLIHLYWMQMTKQVGKFSTASIWGSYIVQIVAVACTFSRSAIIALLSVGILYIFVYKKWKIAGVILVVALCTAYIPGLSGTQKIWRMDTSMARVANWNEGWKAVQSAPLFGVGYNTLQFVRPLENNMSNARSGFDSSILTIVATTGILGISAWMWFFISVVKKKNESTVTLLAILISSLFINALFYPWILLWFFITLATEEQ